MTDREVYRKETKFVVTTPWKGGEARNSKQTTIFMGEGVGSADHFLQTKACGTTAHRPNVTQVRKTPCPAKSS